MNYTNFDLNTKFSDLTKEYLNAGYILMAHDYSSSEIYEVLVKGDEIVVIEMERKCKYGEDSYVFNKYVTVDRKMVKKIASSRIGDWHSWDVIGKNSKCEMIAEYYDISNRRMYYTDSVEEKREVNRKVLERLGNREQMSTQIKGERAMAIALKYLRKQPRMKTVKLSDIESIVKRTYYGGDIAYTIIAKGRGYTLR